jgi:catalase
MGAQALLEKAAIAPDRGVVAIDGTGGIGVFIEAAKDLRIWEREPTLRTPG